MLSNSNFKTVWLYKIGWMTIINLLENNRKKGVHAKGRNFDKKLIVSVAWFQNIDQIKVKRESFYR